MTEQHGSTRVIESQEEIAELLRVAIAHNWNFSYSVADMVPGVSFNTELLSVDPAFDSVTIGSEVKYIGLKDYEPINFRSQSGGISIKFVSSLLPSASPRVTSKLLGECRIVYPVQVQYTQLRQAVRVNFSKIHQIPVTLFLNDGSHITGVVDDMSVTGLRARFNDRKVKQLESSQPITDCVLLLPDKSTVSARVQVLGALQDVEKGTSFLRFRFMQFNDDAELKLEELISVSVERLKILREKPPAKSSPANG
ncbi:MAG: PilZ domain-containing protein [Pseudohongiellaceae bacterium]